MNRPLQPLARRTDGAATRAQLLEAAGAIIAEKGVDRATGKEIAERAGASTNAINYHFGSMEGLHAAVLATAHQSLASLDELLMIARSTAAPEEKLRQILKLVVSAAILPQERSWALPVITREFLSPSPAQRCLVDRDLLPKKQLVISVLAQFLGRPVDDPLVARCSFSFFAPVMMLLSAARESRAEAFPWIGEGEAAVERLTAHLHTFLLGGLKAAKAESKG